MLQIQFSSVLTYPNQRQVYDMIPVTVTEAFSGSMDHWINRLILYSSADAIGEIITFMIRSSFEINRK
jgi:hypothetical protein